MNPTITTDLRPQLSSPVLDQGLRGTCVVVATSQAHQATRGGSPLAPDALWLTIRGPGPSGPDGVYSHEVAAALEQPGQPELTLMPIEMSPVVDLQWPKGITNEPFYRARLDNATGTDAIRAAIAANRIVIVVIEVTDAFQRLASQAAVIDADPVRTSQYGLHAVICVGTGRTAAGDELFLLRNSWGPYWADGGDGWVTADFLDQHGREVLQVGYVHPLT